jgi:hypothetical protein
MAYAGRDCVKAKNQSGFHDRCVFTVLIYGTYLRFFLPLRAGDFLAAPAFFFSGFVDDGRLVDVFLLEDLGARAMSARRDSFFSCVRMPG